LYTYDDDDVWCQIHIAFETDLLVYLQRKQTTENACLPAALMGILLISVQ